MEVTVLEARDRVGGRLHTADLDGVPVDLGAAWVHDGTGSPLLPVFDALGTPLLPAVVDHLLGSASVLNRATGRFPDPRLADGLTGLMGALERDLPRLARRKGNRMSLREAIDSLAGGVPRRRRPPWRPCSACTTVSTPTGSAWGTPRSSSAAGPWETGTGSPGAVTGPWSRPWPPGSTSGRARRYGGSASAPTA
nr:hypothetical protein GCM10020093_007430 [Planobispora longispora]